MSLRHWLAARYPRTAIKPVPHDGRIVLDAATINYPVTAPDLYAANRQFQRDLQPEHHLIMGHYDASVLVHVPDAITLTVLRDPVDRYLSLWRFIAHNPAAYGNLSAQARDMGAYVFAAHYPHLWQNVMTQQLAGTRWTNPVIPVDDALYARALAHLKALHFVCDLPEIGQMCRDIEQVMEWDHLPLPRFNTTTDNAVVDPTDHDALYGLFSIENHYDHQLYDTVQEHFNDATQKESKRHTV